jgi:hypothetical protein
MPFSSFDVFRLCFTVFAIMTLRFTRYACYVTRCLIDAESAQPRDAFTLLPRPPFDAVFASVR